MSVRTMADMIEAARGYYAEDYSKGAKPVLPRYWAEGK
jgi:hypothetical protein